MGWDGMGNLLMTSKNKYLEMGSKNITKKMANCNW